MTENTPVDLPDFDIDNDVIASLLEKLTLETQIKDAFPDEAFDSPDEVFTILQSLEKSTRTTSVESIGPSIQFPTESNSVLKTFEQCSDLLDSQQLVKDCFLSSFGLSSRKLLETKNTVNNAPVFQNFSIPSSSEPSNNLDLYYKSDEICDKLPITACNFPLSQTDNSNLKSIDSLYEVFHDNEGKVFNFDLTTLGQNDSDSSSVTQCTSTTFVENSLPLMSFNFPNNSIKLNLQTNNDKSLENKYKPSMSDSISHCWQYNDKEKQNKTGLKRPYSKSNILETNLDFDAEQKSYSSYHKRPYTVSDNFERLTNSRPTDIKTDSLDSCSSESNSTTSSLLPPSDDEFRSIGEKSISSPDSGFHDAYPESPSGSYVLDLDNTSDEELQQIIEAFFDYESLYSETGDPPFKCFENDTADYDEHIERIVRYLQTPAVIEAEDSESKDSCEKDSSSNKMSKAKKFKLGCRIKYAIKNGKELRHALSLTKAKNGSQCNKILKQIKSDKHFQERIKVFQLLHKRLKRTVADDRGNKKQRIM